MKNMFWGILALIALSFTDIATAATVIFAWDIPLNFNMPPGNGNYLAICLRKKQPPTAEYSYVACDWRDTFTSATVSLPPSNDIACFSIWTYLADSEGNPLQWSQAGSVLGHPDIQQICIDPNSLGSPNNFMVYPQPTP